MIQNSSIYLARNAPYLLKIGTLAAGLTLGYTTYQLTTYVKENHILTKPLLENKKVLLGIAAVLMASGVTLLIGDPLLVISSLFFSTLGLVVGILKKQTNTVSTSRPVTVNPSKTPEINVVKPTKLDKETEVELPSWVFFLESGNLSMDHFNCFLNGTADHPECRSKPLPQEQKDRLILRSFSMRKSPKFADLDTMNIPKNCTPLIQNDWYKALVTKDAEGKWIAISSSAHDIEGALFLESIETIEPCVRYETVQVLDSPIYIGYYADGSSMIQQPATRACVPTCMVMLLKDRGVNNIDLEKVARTNLSTDEVLNRDLQKYGYKLEPLDFSVSNVKEWIKKNGSVFASVSGSIGSHKIIIDSIDDEFTMVRDPFHGWRVRLKTTDFMKEVCGVTVKGMVKLTP